jgi:hypothetical protein
MKRLAWNTKSSTSCEGRELAQADGVQACKAAEKWLTSSTSRAGMPAGGLVAAEQALQAKRLARQALKRGDRDGVKAP